MVWVKKNGRDWNFGVGGTDDFINFYYDSEVLLYDSDISSLWSLHTLYCNQHYTQSTVCYVNCYSIISMRVHYFQKSED